MTLREYQEFIHGFPRHGSEEAALNFMRHTSPLVFNFMLGIQEEVGELYEVIFGQKRITQKIRKGILLESGDILWQVAATLEAFNIPLENALEAAKNWKGSSALKMMSLTDFAISFGIATGKLYKAAKKCLRDGDGVITDHVRSQVMFAGGRIIWHLIALLETSGLTFEQAADANREKLLSRIERGTAQGEGSYR